MFGKQDTANGAPKPAPSGAMMLLRTMGFDPEAIMQGVEAAKVEALRVMAHFDARLTAVESALKENQVVLNDVRLLLEEQKKQNTTKPDTTEGA